MKYNFDVLKRGLPIIVFHVSMLNRTLQKEFCEVLGFFSTLLVFVPFFDFSTFSPCGKAFVSVLLIILGVGLYAYLWVRANRIQKVKFRINNSQIIVRYGDIFQCDGWKVIPFNEYFDTVVDDVVISQNSLHGIFLSQYADSEKLSEVLLTIKKQKKLSRQNKRCPFPLGTIVPYEGYFLLAFSRFDENNRANLSMLDYWQCLLNFWNEADIAYAGKDIHIPLIGSGITRFDRPLNPQDLLELLIVSFKTSGWQISHGSTINIVLSPRVRDQINLFRLKEFFNGL
ncbi:MAG: DUF6430 domain-containing protein [Planctomycetia bacterium]|nr:DUF6430 domain-containing protein [Planctomycetia bacterium]